MIPGFLLFLRTMRTHDVILINPCGRTGEIVSARLSRHGLRVLTLTGPSARKNEDLYIRTLKKAVEETGAEMIVPVFFPEVLAAHKEEFPGVLIPLDTADNIMLLDDKLSACRLVSGLGIRQPRIYGDISEVEDFPVVFKRPSGQGGDSVYFPKTRRALENLSRTSAEYLVEDFVEGENVSVDAVRWSGGFFHAAAYRVLLPHGKGVSTLRESMDAPELVESVKTILDAVDYKGVCGVDFIRESGSGEYFFLECNPRFSGGIESAIASGFDIPWVYWCLAHGESVPRDCLEFKSGIRTGI